MLLEMRDYLRANSPVTMRDLTYHYNMDAETLRPMLDHWVRKGKLLHYDFAASCSSSAGCGCSVCGSSGSCSVPGVQGTFEVYEWQEEGQTPDAGTHENAPKPPAGAGAAVSASGK